MERGLRQAATAGCLVAGLLLVSTIALAEAVSGTLAFRGELSIPKGSGMIATPLATYVPAAESLSSLEIRAPAGRITIYESVYMDVDAIDPLPIQIQRPGSFSARSWTASNIHLMLTPDGNHTGILGVHPGEQASLANTALAETVIEAREVSHLGNFQGTGEDEPSFETYHEDVAESHLFILAQGIVTLA